MVSLYPHFWNPPSNLTAHDMWKCRNSLHRSTSDCVARQGGTGGTEVPPAGAEGIAAVLRSWHHVGFLWSTFSTDHSGTTIPLTTLTSWSSCLRSSQVWDLTGMIRYKAGAFFFPSLRVPLEYPSMAWNREGTKSSVLWTSWSCQFP